MAKCNHEKKDLIWAMRKLKCIKCGAIWNEEDVKREIPNIGRPKVLGLINEK